MRITFLLFVTILSGLTYALPQGSPETLEFNGALVAGPAKGKRPGGATDLAEETHGGKVVGKGKRPGRKHPGVKARPSEEPTDPAKGKAAMSNSKTSPNAILGGILS
ncbi:unnamed protein product [Mucor hiemalis]